MAKEIKKKMCIRDRNIHGKEGAVMNRSQLDKYITDYYGVRAERLFEKNPGFQAYRHNDTKKWFAMIMDLPESRLGLDGQKIIDVVNLKCDPILIGSLRLEPVSYTHLKKEWNKNGTV